ncbi:hypothetical protein LTR10_017698 [Elasticomyces elasticus]|uniref:Fe2OG dioxygenase domain-containing protein n=1 Tax=Exophiala sideris TaxID=1016849 RepID=A0ABR0JBH1_9EURO|nr:hypothetical protein LTR10_017698 [Elasticomyces elasticus]KAK5031053.1 hypothetical protein LTS07_004788 [Exophiala sideris]KAK5038775.1 hypothetical protein LTR13_003806 [Exophiala sideris]KAK5060658.1 hypothetical protein LTR69_005257 [Exophiala sideris]KAK5183571.1 hypothetical protein LTR44_003853 [Eurotiomycetes sp. CCFEE 6388]
MTDAIPIVSFEKFLTGNRADQQQVAQQVYDAFSTVGFIYLKDYGIPQSRVDEVFALAKTFFDLPLSEKLNYKLSEARVNQGYTADGAEGINDHKECYEHRRFTNALCPDEMRLPGFRTKLDAFYGQCLSLSMDVLKCLAMVLGLGDDFFTHITEHADPQMRLVHYPPLERRIIEEQGHARIMPHTDFGLCTLLFQDGVGGLEIDPHHDGNFVAAPPVPGTVLVNMAELLTRYTNGRVKSTKHRVVGPSLDKYVGDMLPARFSIPFFVHPDPETIIDPIVLSNAEQKLYEPVNAGEWRIWNTKKDYRLNEAESQSLEVETVG